MSLFSYLRNSTVDDGKDPADVTSITQAKKDNEIETGHNQSHAAIDHG